MDTVIDRAYGLYMDNEKDNRFWTGRVLHDGGPRQDVYDRERDGGITISCPTELVEWVCAALNAQIEREKGDG